MYPPGVDALFFSIATIDANIDVLERQLIFSRRFDNAAFRAEDKMRLELSFQDNQVYLSISTRRELFEPPIKTPVTDLEDFKSNFKYLVNTTGLLQRLTLVNN